MDHLQNKSTGIHTKPFSKMYTTRDRWPRKQRWREVLPWRLRRSTINHLKRPHEGRTAKLGHSNEIRTRWQCRISPTTSVAWADACGKVENQATWRTNFFSKATPWVPVGREDCQRTWTTENRPGKPPGWWFVGPRPGPPGPPVYDTSTNTAMSVWIDQLTNMLDDNFQVSQRPTSDLTTTPQQCDKEIDNYANRADQQSASSGLQQCQMKSVFWEDKGERKKTQIRRNCATQNMTALLDWWVSTPAQGHANLLCINTDRDTQSKKETKLQRCSGPFRCSRMFTRFQRCSSQQQRYQGHESFRRIQENKYRATKNWCARQKLPTTWNVRRAQTRRENEVPTKNREKEVNAKFSRVGTFVRYTTMDVLKSTVKIEIRWKKTCAHVLPPGQPVWWTRQHLGQFLEETGLYDYSPQCSCFANTWDDSALLWERAKATAHSTHWGIPWSQCTHGHLRVGRYASREPLVATVGSPPFTEPGRSVLLFLEWQTTRKGLQLAK